MLSMVKVYSVYRGQLLPRDEVTALETGRGASKPTLANELGAAKVTDRAASTGGAQDKNAPVVRDTVTKQIVDSKLTLSPRSAPTAATGEVALVSPSSAKDSLAGPSPSDFTVT
jgi:hypothetical protein